MSRRNEGTVDVVASLPWPVGAAMGLVAFVAIRYGGLLFENSPNPILSHLGHALGNGALSPIAWIVLIVFWVAAASSYFRARKRKRLFETAKGLDRIAQLSWREFEMLVGEAFQRQGYAVEELGGGGADGGVDLMLRRAGELHIVQCKLWQKRQVGVKVVREMWGLVQHHSAVSARIVCIGDFSRDAVEFAADKPIELISGDVLIRMIEQVQGNGEVRLASPTPQERVTLVAQPPTCPVCQARMQTRRNRRTGQSFWGCSNYPTCTGKPR